MELRNKGNNMDYNENTRRLAGVSVGATGFEPVTLCL